MQGDKARLVFISEYMTSGSLKKFLKKTRTNNKTISAKVYIILSKLMKINSSCVHLKL